MKNWKSTFRTCIAILALVCVQSSPLLAYTLRVDNAAGFPIDIYMGYKTSLCHDVNWETVNPGQSKVDHTGGCALDWIGARKKIGTNQYIEAQHYQANGYFGDGVWTVVFPANTTLNEYNKSQFRVVQASSTNLGHIITGGISDAAQTVGDGAVVASHWVAERFRDTKVTRSVDYGIRKAGLESALAIAKGVLGGSQDIALASLIAARETANASLVVAEGFLNQVGKNVATGVLKGSAEAAKGILEGVKQTTMGVIEGGKLVITQGPLDWFDITQIYWKENFKQLMSGVLGNVKIQAELFKQNFNTSVTIDPKKSFDDLVNVFKPIINTVVATMKNKILDPLSDAASKIEKTLEPVKEQANTPVQLPATVVSALQQSQQATQTALTAAQQNLTTLNDKTVQAGTQIETTLTQTKEQADKALQDQIATFGVKDAAATEQAAAVQTPSIPAPLVTPTAAVVPPAPNIPPVHYSGPPVKAPNPQTDTAPTQTTTSVKPINTTRTTINKA